MSESLDVQYWEGPTLNSGSLSFGLTKADFSGRRTAWTLVIACHAVHRVSVGALKSRFGCARPVLVKSRLLTCGNGANGQLGAGSKALAILNSRLQCLIALCGCSGPMMVSPTTHVLVLTLDWTSYQFLL